MVYQLLDGGHRSRFPVADFHERRQAHHLAVIADDCTDRRDGCGPAKIMRSTASKLIRPGGDRVKTDARDATHLTRLLRLGEITAVTVPEREVEAVRDLVRAREDAQADLVRVRHR